MTQYNVVFMPDETSIEVEEGTTIADAAYEAGIAINNLCGGQGVCGRCRVQVTKGKAEAEEHARAFFSEEQINEGFVLACQTEIHDNLEIAVPPESRMEESQILMTGAEESVPEWGLVPMARKIYLELPPPTLDDNISDLDRISRELRKKLGWHSYDVSLGTIQKLSDRLRDNDWKVTATVVKSRNGYRILKIDPGDTTQHNYGLAVDVGTTTLVAQLVDLNSQSVLGVVGSPNPQASYGEDVISRMVYACGKGGTHPLHEAVIKEINQMIERLCKKHDVPSEEINAIVAAGNTTMSHFLLNLTPCNIRLEPYVPTADVPPQILAHELGINVSSDATLDTIPSVASYVGGDIVSGVMACGIPDQDEIKALIDIGTNGEIAIGNQDWLVCCSASAGPAFEGGGTTCGMRATTGAIQEVEISDGKVTYKTIGNVKPRGLCGSALIDAIYELVKSGIIRPDGKFDRDLKDDRLSIHDNVPQYLIASSEETESGRDLAITESDIDNLMKSKGAVFAALKSLIDYIGLGFEQLNTIYVAGGFGTYLNIPKAVGIGLLPDIPQENILFVGNSCLTGARMSLLSEAALEKCINISRSMTNIELSIYPPFMDEFMAALFLPHTEKKLFPSVSY